MAEFKSWLSKHTYEIHTLAFGLMVLASVGLYFAARAGSPVWIWGLIGLFAFSNVMVLVVK